MNDIQEILKSFYVGDEACKSITIDGWNKEVRIQVTCIYRGPGVLEGALVGGQILFRGVSSIEITPAGIVPNDLINDIRAIPVEGRLHAFELSIDSATEEGLHTEVIVRIVAEAISIRPSAENHGPDVDSRDFADSPGRRSGVGALATRASGTRAPAAAAGLWRTQGA